MIETNNLSVQIRLLRSVLDFAGEAFIVTDCMNHVVEWNEKAQHLLGWTVEEAVGRSLCELISLQGTGKRPGKSLKRTRQPRLDECDRQPLRVNAQHKDGHEILVELTSNAFKIDEDVFYWIEIRDGLRQILYENSLQQQAALLNLSRDSIIVCDLD